MLDLPLPRPYRLHIMARALQDRAEALAREGRAVRAWRLRALADGLRFEAGCDWQGVRIALSEAKAYRRMERRCMEVRADA